MEKFFSKRVLLQSYIQKTLQSVHVWEKADTLKHKKMGRIKKGYSAVIEEGTAIDTVIEK